MVKYSEKDVLTVGEVARLFDITVQAVHGWLRTGRIRRSFRTSKKGKYKVPRQEVVRLLKHSNKPVAGFWEPGEIARKKVLIIDDYEKIRRLVKNSFANSKFKVEVETAANIVDGSILMSSFNPDLVLLDYFKAPDPLHGDLALAFIKAIKRKKGVKLIGFGGDKRIEQCMLKAGADAFLRKPFGLEELKDQVFTQLFRERRREERRIPLQGTISDRLRRS